MLKSFICALTILLSSLIVAHAQTAVDYRFLEVVDSAGKPVAGATVEDLDHNSRPMETDENGVVKDFPVYSGDFNTRGIKISKPGYLTFEQTELHAHRYSRLLKGEVPGYADKKIKVVLLQTPNTPEERAAVEIEQRKRELILAVKSNDVPTVQRLLAAGVSPNPRDVYGIPVILWAAVKGNPITIKALLAAGADVQNKEGTGRKALRYYLDSVPDKQNQDAEVIRLLSASPR